MPEKTIKRVARIAEIARHAGVSTATVDRVLNGRANVRAATRQCVLQAQAALETGSVHKDLDRPWRLKVILPRGAGPSTDYFATCIQEIGKQGSATIECEFTAKMEPVQLARKLRACQGQRVDAVAFQALDDPRVVNAVAELAAADIPCFSVLSGLEHAEVIGYTGMNNRAAGRAAGVMMGHMLKTPGDILIITGGDLYRAHEAREMGFRAVIRHQFPQVGIAASLTGQDNSDLTREVVTAALQNYPQLVGIYNVGGGNQGLVAALQAAGVAGEFVTIGHNLTVKTHAYLLDGSMDAVIHQNLQLAARYTVESLIAHLSGSSMQPGIIPVEIITRENTEGAVFDRTGRSSKTI